jgi:hypothetical protein
MAIHTALIFEIRADDEIKIEVWHWSPLPSFQLANYNPSRPVPSLQL